jgi:light-regulated signal transduction histidine kinase (bacteriophytochrome)
MTDEVKEIKKELNRFAYAVSHDLQAPLRIVNGYVKIIQRQLTEGDNEELKEYIGQAVDGVKQMEEYLKDLLDYSRVMHSEVTYKTIKVPNLIEVVKYALRNEIEATNAQIIAEDIPETMEGSKELIKQLFFHLIGNAIKFRKEDTQPIIEIKGIEKEDSWYFTIADNGIGIPENSYERIFELFQQLHAPGKYDGNGVGLAICKKIVAMHNGDISVSSPDGSKFTFNISK